MSQSVTNRHTQLSLFDVHLISDCWGSCTTSATCGELQVCNAFQPAPHGACMPQPPCQSTAAALLLFCHTTQLVHITQMMHVIHFMHVTHVLSRTSYHSSCGPRRRCSSLLKLLGCLLPAVPAALFRASTMAAWSGLVSLHNTHVSRTVLDDSACASQPRAAGDCNTYAYR